MQELMGVAEVAETLGVSERRVRALIHGGKLPAQCVMGRWGVPANKVSIYRAAPPGRPMAQKSAWAVLNHLDHGVILPARLNRRVSALRDARDPVWRLQAWMSARGCPLAVRAFQPVIEALNDDDRVVVSGDRAVMDLEAAGPLRVYADAAYVGEIVDDLGLRQVGGYPLPGAIIWAVADIRDIPRDDNDARLAAPVVAALDLLDDGDPRAVSIARPIINNAIRKCGV